MRRAGEVTPVPVEAAAVTGVEIMHLHTEHGTEHGWVPGKRATHRRGAAPLAPDDQQTGQHSPRATVPTGHHQAPAPGPPGGTGQISSIEQPCWARSRCPAVPDLGNRLATRPRAHQPTVPGVVRVIMLSGSQPLPPWAVRRCAETMWPPAPRGKR